jgi:hypothetical protein
MDGFSMLERQRSSCVLCLGGVNGGVFGGESHEQEKEEILEVFMRHICDPSDMYLGGLDNTQKSWEIHKDGHDCTVYEVYVLKDHINTTSP